jgi:hypothetical protein
MDNAWLKQELEKRGHGAKGALAQFLGISAPAMSKRLNGFQAIPEHEAARISLWLEQAQPAAPRSWPQRAPAAPRRPAQALAPVDLRGQDLPVWAAAQGGDQGAMLIVASPIDWIARPRELLVRDAFAVFLLGDSMSPRYDHGDQLYVHPHRPPRNGDDCLFVQEVDGEGQFLGLAKTLVRATADKWRVRQFNPEREFELDRQRWTKAWKIVGKMNRV